MFTVLFYSTATHPGKMIDAIAKRNEMLQVSETGLIKKRTKINIFFKKREKPFSIAAKVVGTLWVFHTESKHPEMKNYLELLGLTVVMWVRRVWSSCSLESSHCGGGALLLVLPSVRA